MQEATFQMDGTPFYVLNQLVQFFNEEQEQWWDHAYPYGSPEIPESAEVKGHPDVFWAPNGMVAFVRPGAVEAAVEECRVAEEVKKAEAAAGWDIDPLWG